MHSDINQQISTTTCSDYIPINTVQRITMAIGSGLICLASPANGHQLATFGEVSTPVSVISSLRDKMMADDVGVRILAERPRITNESVKAARLMDLPVHTFGHQYHRFCNYYGYSPDERRKVQFVKDESLAYIFTRYRQIHDMTHVILGMPTNLLGEIVVKKFEAKQLGLPMCILAATFSTLRLGPVHFARYVNVALPWIIKNAKQCSKPMLNVYFEREWATPIDQLRYRLNISPPPPEIRAKWIS